jgi:eukaryotic-like serine/threonine-protein kinase
MPGETNDGQRYRWMVELFQRCCELPGPEREDLLRASCGADPDVAARVRELLQWDSRAGDPLDRAARGASDLLAADGEEAPWMPERIGDFRVRRLLGSGGMGIVYEAEQDNPRRLVALKVVRPGMTTPRNLRRFELEAEVLGRLEHPGIASIHAAGMAETPWGRVPFLAMDYVRGRGLAEHCSERGLGRRERLELLVRVCAAVEHAHAKGVVHRDLKASNVLVGDDGQPKVLDFGVARLIEAEGDTRTGLTLEGQVVGTLATMSPEQLRGDPHGIDARTDSTPSERSATSCWPGVHRWT